ncbi:hypothetical protein XYCOK13_19340 [Xylanibacillus composti]|uniref:Leader peptide-processing serine protease n=1 Tax=Xylanibacillus composti TaxID=1572762 RepID=A0A8J4M2G7_9BACL|nr:hypothetical protein XYCOK13_19340 [Xylanibacillus composti]
MFVRWTIGFVVMLMVFASVNVSAESPESQFGYYTVLKSRHVTYDNFIRQVQQRGLELVYEIREIDIYQLRGTADQIRLLGQSTSVENYNRSVRAVEPSFSPMTAPRSVDLPELWELQWDMHELTNQGSSYQVYAGSPHVVVGIVDSGLAINHPDLAANVRQGSKNLVPAGGFRGTEPNETGAADRLADLTGHGTHTAGQVAANGLMKGVAPNTGIRAYRVFGSTSAETVWVLKAIVEAAKDNVDVINLSLGSYLIKGKTFSADGKGNQDLVEIEGYRRAINYARRAGSVIVAAVGNDGINERDRKQFRAWMQAKLAEDGVRFTGNVYDVPAALPGVVTVSSVGPTGQLSSFSNYGNGLIDIAAPGGDTRYLEQYGMERWLAEGWYQKELILSTAPNGAYFFSSGTSAATPKVSGALALIIGKYGYQKNPGVAERHLFQYGVDRSKGRDKAYFGNGHLNVYQAVSR